MRRTIFHIFFFMLLLVPPTTLLYLTCIPSPAAYALTNSAKKPELTLNRTQGPLGVTLTLRGMNFPPGSAGLSYIDADNVPGIFAPPDASSVVVLSSGAFLTTDLLLPASGPAGNWKIIVTDSQGNLTTINYTVLATPGQKIAGAPSLILTLPDGTTNATPSASATTTPTETTAVTPTVITTTTSTASSSGNNTITFTGSNWLPKATAVKLMLTAQSTSLPLLGSTLVSNSKGMISGSFKMPSNLPYSSATIIATDTATGALQVQVPITITSGVVSFSTGTTPTPSPETTPVTSAANTPVPSSNSSAGNLTNPLANMNAAIWGPVLLVAGAMLAIAGLMLILFMLPWSRSNHSDPHTRGRQ
jgi:hypothetical protein